jgi:hypothetical protein
MFICDGGPASFSYGAVTSLPPLRTFATHLTGVAPDHYLKLQIMSGLDQAPNGWKNPRPGEPG